MSLLAVWKSCNDALIDVYRLAAREKEQGYDRESTRAAMDRAERAEHAAWLAYRDSSESTEEEVTP